MKPDIFDKFPFDVKMKIFNEYIDPKVKCFICTPKNGLKVVKFKTNFKDNNIKTTKTNRNLYDYYCKENNQVVYFNCDNYQLQFYDENMLIENLESTHVKMIYMRESKIKIFFSRLLTMRNIFNTVEVYGL